MPDSANPWLSRPTVTPKPTTLAPDENVLPPATGPVAPQEGITAPDQVDRLPTVSHRTSAPLWILGVHGGAGESTLAKLDPSWSAAGHGWPQVHDGTQSRVILVARSNMHGLRAAQSAATQWAAGLVPNIQVFGLVIVADAPGKLPRPLRDFARLVGGGVPRTWMVPWNESWRLGSDPIPSESPREVRKLISDLYALMTTDAANSISL